MKSQEIRIRWVVAIMLVTSLMGCTYGNEDGHTQVSGNGEGYTGKLEGVYAQVDTSQSCPDAPGDKTYALKSKIEIEDGKAQFTKRNCKEVSEAIDGSQLDLNIQDAGMISFQGVVYQKLADPDADFVAAFEFYRWYCRGLRNTQAFDGTDLVQTFLREADPSQAGADRYTALLRRILPSTLKPVTSLFLSQYPDVTPLGYLYQHEGGANQTGVIQFQLGLELSSETASDLKVPMTIQWADSSEETLEMGCVQL